MGRLPVILMGVIYRRTSNHWITPGGKSSVYRGILYSLRFILGPNEILKEHLSLWRHYLLSLVFVGLMGPAYFEIKMQIVATQNRRKSIISSHKVDRVISELAEVMYRLMPSPTSDNVEQQLHSLIAHHQWFCLQNQMKPLWDTLLL